MRNPENIDLDLYPPPAGYVVATEGDVAGYPGIVPDGWMLFQPKFGWQMIQVPLLLKKRWTYLRPITPSEESAG